MIWITAVLCHTIAAEHCDSGQLATREIYGELTARE